MFSLIFTKQLNQRCLNFKLCSYIINTVTQYIIAKPVVYGSRLNATLLRQLVSIIREPQMQFMVLTRSNFKIYDVYLQNYCLYFLSSRASLGIAIYQKPLSLTLSPLILLLNIMDKRLANDSLNIFCAKNQMSSVQSALPFDNSPMTVKNKISRSVSIRLWQPPQIIGSRGTCSQMSQHENPQRHTFHNNRITTWLEK